MIQDINHLNLEQEIALKIKNKSGGTYNKDNQIMFKT